MAFWRASEQEYLSNAYSQQAARNQLAAMGSMGLGAAVNYGAVDYGTIGGRIGRKMTFLEELQHEIKEWHGDWTI